MLRRKQSHIKVFDKDIGIPSTDSRHLSATLDKCEAITMLSQGYLRTLCIATISLLSLLPTELAAKSGSPRPQHKLEDSIEAKPPGPALPGSKPSAGDSKGTPLDAIVVGPGGKYSTVQAGVTVAMQKCSSGGSVTISISAGTYREQVNIPGGSKCKLIIKGATSSDGHNAVTITYAGARQPYQKTATMFVGADDIAVYNLNVENTFGTGAQAVALFAQSARGRQAYYGCSFKGYQDTLFASAAQTYFRDCSITGAWLRAVLHSLRHVALIMPSHAVSLFPPRQALSTSSSAKREMPGLKSAKSLSRAAVG